MPTEHYKFGLNFPPFSYFEDQVFT